MQVFCWLAEKELNTFIKFLGQYKSANQELSFASLPMKFSAISAYGQATFQSIRLLLGDSSILHKPAVKICLSCSSVMLLFVGKLKNEGHLSIASGIGQEFRRCERFRFVRSIVHSLSTCGQVDKKERGLSGAIGLRLPLSKSSPSKPKGETPIIKAAATLGEEIEQNIGHGGEWRRPGDRLALC